MITHKTNKIIVKCQFTTFVTEEELHLLLEDWLVLVRLIFKPQLMKINCEKKRSFDLDYVQSLLRSLNGEVDENQQVELSDPIQGCFGTLSSKGGILKQTFLLSHKIYYQKESVIEDYISQKMEIAGMFSYCRDYDEFLYHNEKRVDSRSFDTERSQCILPKCYNDQKELIIDCDRLPGYDLYVNLLCFTSCWKMWFSSYYYPYIPKKMIMDLQQVEHVEEVRENIVKVTLSKKAEVWSQRDILYSQELMRDQLGIHQLKCDNGVGILRDPIVEINRTKEGIRCVHYQNDYFQPVAKRQASQLVVQFFDYSEQKCKEKRYKEGLSLHDFFPMVNEEKKQMMNYHILNPERSIDRGVEAYEFYIRQHLEIQKKDFFYEEYQTTLRFFIPKGEVKKIPYEELRKKLFDVKLSECKLEEEVISFQIEKKNRILNVVFSDQQQIQLY